MRKLLCRKIVRLIIILTFLSRKSAITIFNYFVKIRAKPKPKQE